MIAFCIDQRGVMTTLYTEKIDLHQFGRVALRRASHVEPTDDARWIADLSPVGGPILGPYDKRSEALAAEVEYIQKNVLKAEVNTCK